MEINGVNEVVHVAESSSGVLDPLYACIDGFTGGISDAMFQKRDDVWKSTFEHSSDFDHRLKSAANGPLMPPVKVTARRLFVDIIE